MQQIGVVPLERFQSAQLRTSGMAKMTDCLQCSSPPALRGYPSLHIATLFAPLHATLRHSHVSNRLLAAQRVIHIKANQFHCPQTAI